MKKNYFRLLSIVSLVALTACSGNGHDKHAAPETATPPTEQELVSHSGVKLNNGEKWKANPETTEGIENMSTLLGKFPDNAVLDDYHALKPQLESEIENIFNKCTMEGEAHEQLHAYLIPLTKMMEYLGSKDIEYCKMSVNELKQHLAEYKSYFE